MQIPLQIRFHKLEPSEAIEAAIRKRAEKLEQFAHDIISCRVTIEAPHKHHHQGNLYHVTIDIRTPAGEVVVSRSPDQHQAHEDAYVAIRNAFKAARRRLQDQLREQRHKVKVHETPPHGRVSALHAADSYGTITDSNGREIYFHRNSVVNDDFDELEIGAEVRFAEEGGDKGPQASSVHVIGKHHIVG
ncbi:MAG: HPF/RaiA family ribosome-associated protein [Gammaproteobacteria bacterium]|nr:HPF/RaiA family ribosome-associated protein [Gammaproteobacteria bacterium]